MKQRRFYSDLAHFYSSSLKLPKTSLPNKPTAVDQALLDQIGQSLYEKQFQERDNSKLFILHDGPPYANGNLHLGHSLNKVLKDIINRQHLIRGHKIFYKPGWDCHGLPIELKSMESLTKRKMKPTEITTKIIRQESRNHALTTIDIQRRQFLQFGIMGDFSNPYITLDHDYEINQLRLFRTLFEKGLVSRQEKPVFWGCETNTALAEGELEYNPQHVSKAAYIKFPLKMTEKLDQLLQVQNPQLLIWTSTPWTILANKAICVNKDFVYTVIKNELGDNLIVSQDLVDSLVQLRPDFVHLKHIQIPGELLVSGIYSNPIIPNSEFPILHGDHVVNNAGTGLVHTAPGHGNEDYLVGLANKLEIYSPVDNHGAYTSKLPQGFESLVGLKVLHEGNKQMLKLLDDSGMIFKIDSKYVHSYPYDWRSKKPIIIRSTPQWFINVEEIKESALKSLDDVEFVPLNGKNRLNAFIKNRNEWCISRQRSWGVPIPVLYNKISNEPLIDLTVLDHIIDRINLLGTDEWFVEEQSVERWLPESLMDEKNNYYKGRDTMDVWFDSGSSWRVVEEFLKENNIQRDGPLADIYLEGSDQHRGWFQSSLLNRIATNEDFAPVAPYKKIITHGFTLDSKLKKMSKSLGNIIEPESLLFGKNGHPSLGTDGLRLWAASTDYTNDVVVGPIVLKQTNEFLRKFRFTFRFLLGNLNDFSTKDMVSYEDLAPFDRYTLSKLYTLQQKTNELYEQHQYSKVVKDVVHNMTSDLSALYFDISKDCLYTSSPGSHERRSIQTVFSKILTTYISIMAPIIPILAQETWNHTPEFIKKGVDSPFLVDWKSTQLPESYFNTASEDEFALLWTINDKIRILLEKGRAQDKVLKNSLETCINLNFKSDSQIGKTILAHSNKLDQLFLVSKVSINEPIIDDLKYRYDLEFDLQEEPIHLTLSPSSHHKCPRCWKYTAENADQLCGPCDEVIGELKC